MQVAALTRVALYERRVRASLERVWENVLDWEHLPWLHASSFSHIHCEESGAWGWRARVGLQPQAPPREILLELRIERPALRYVSRTLAGPGAGTEIWTQLAPAGPTATDIEVGFHVPDVAPDRADALGRAFTALYERLWDEDEAMMRRRSDALAPRARPLEPLATAAPVRLGRLAELRARLPLCVEVAGHGFRLLERDGELVAHSVVCPHRLGPLEEAELVDGSLRCPWHGYRFELATGRCLDRRGLQLAPAPQVEVDPDTREVLLHPSRPTRAPPASGGRAR